MRYIIATRQGKYVEQKKNVNCEKIGQNTSPISLGSVHTTHHIMHFPRLSLSVHAYHRVEIVWELIIVTNDIFWHKKDSLKKNKHTPASAQPTATATIISSKIENKYYPPLPVGSHTPPEIILYLFLIINRLGGKCQRRKNRPKARITITSSSSFLSGTAGWGNRVYC